MLPVAPLTLAAQALSAALLASTAVLDCNPTLFWFDKWRSLSERLGGGGRRSSNTIWIIGASSGIGQELVCQMAKVAGIDSSFGNTTPEPLHLIISSRNQSKLEQMALDLESPICRITTVPMDVTNNDDIAAAVHSLQTSKVVLDTVVLNAGFGHLTPALETLPSTAEAVFRGNALWPMILMPLLAGPNSTTLFRDRPHIVVTASVASYIPVPLSATYCAAKHALLGYFRSLQAEDPRCIIQLVSPGPVETAFHQNHAQGRTDPSPRPSRLKMPVARCAQLIRRTIEQRRAGEHWIASQPLLTLLYLHHWCPGLVRFITGRVGPKRIDLWRRGKDLYDPQSWRE